MPSSSVSTALTTTRDRKVSLVRRVINLVRGSAAGSRPAQYYPPSPFEEWDFARTTDAIEEAFDAQTIDVARRQESLFSAAPGQVSFLPRLSYTNPIIVNRAFFQGDHWQNGDGWIGPHPAATDAAFSDSMQEIANIFTSKNVIKEATTRHALGVVGRPLAWSFTPTREMKTDEEPTAEEQKLIDEAESLMRRWVNGRKVMSMLKDAVCTLLLSERAAIRLMVPPGMAQRTANGDLVVQAASIEDALRFIFPEHPLPDNATVITDADTKTEAGCWSYNASLSAEQLAALAEGGEANVRLILPGGELGYGAITFIDENGITVTRIFAEGATEPDSESRLDLGGKLTMFEMRRQVLVTLQVQQAQRALNLAESMIPRTAITSGFMERTLMDAQLPGRPEVDAEGNKTGRWIEEPFYVGAGTTNFIQSAEFMDEEGRVKRATGSIHYRDPIGAQGPIEASTQHYRNMLDETGQLHVVMAGESNPSGASRVNARIEYLSTLQLTQSEVESCFRFIVDTALAMAEALARKPGYYTDKIRAQAQCRLDTGPLLPAERTAIESSIGKTISQETAMMLLGIEDIEAEKARMAQDPLARAALGKAVGEALTALTTPGATLEGAAKFIGMEPDLLKDLLTAPVAPPTLAPVEKSPLAIGAESNPQGGAVPGANTPGGAKTQPVSNPGSAPGGGAPASGATK